MLPREALCPECAEPVLASLRVAAEREVAYPSLIGDGAGWIACGLVLTAMIVPPIVFLGLGLLLLGALLITARDPRVRDESWFSLRRVTRIALVAAPTVLVLALVIRGVVRANTGALIALAGAPPVLLLAYTSLAMQRLGQRGCALAAAGVAIATASVILSAVLHALRRSGAWPLLAAAPLPSSALLALVGLGAGIGALLLYARISALFR